MKLYSAILPSGKPIIATRFRPLFFICCGFNWTPGKPAAATMTIKDQPFAAFMREWQGKIEDGKRRGGSRA